MLIIPLLKNVFCLPKVEHFPSTSSCSIRSNRLTDLNRDIQEYIWTENILFILTRRHKSKYGDSNHIPSGSSFSLSSSEEGLPYHWRRWLRTSGCLVWHWELLLATTVKPDQSAKTFCLSFNHHNMFHHFQWKMAVAVKLFSSVFILLKLTAGLIIFVSFPNTEDHLCRCKLHLWYYN